MPLTMPTGVVIQRTIDDALPSIGVIASLSTIFLAAIATRIRKKN